MEIWDAYDEKLNKIEGMTLVRGEEVPDGVFHLVCEIIVKHADGRNVGSHCRRVCASGRRSDDLCVKGTF